MARQWPFWSEAKVTPLLYPVYDGVEAVVAAVFLADGAADACRR